MILIQQYKYIAINMEGKKIQGVFSDISQEHAFQKLRQLDYYPIQIKAVNNFKKNGFSDSKVPDKYMAVFCYKLSTIVKSGIPLMEALKIIQKQTDYKQLESILDDMYLDIQNGYSLAQSIKKYNRQFPSIFAAIVEIGETSGNLDTCLKRAGNFFETRHNLRKKIKKAFVYPTMVLIATLSLLYLLLTYIFPMYVSMFEQNNIDLPNITKALISISGFFARHGIYLIVGILIAILAVNVYKTNNSGRLKLDKMKLNMPVYGKIFRQLFTIEFSGALCMLLDSGLNLVNSLGIIADIMDNYAIKDLILQAQHNVNYGGKLSNEIKKLNLFPSLFVEMLYVGESSGNIIPMVDQVTYIYIQEVQADLEKILSLIEPVTIIILGVIVGFIVLAIILPMTELIGILK